MKIWQRTVAVVATFALLFNSLAIPLTVLAQEVTPEPTPEATAQPTDTPTPTIEATTTPEVTPTPDATPTEIATPLPEVTPTPSPWTLEKVELNKEYIAPQNSEIKLTFIKLPDPSGNIKIEEITLTEEQIQQTGSLSNKAYDITSDMADGSFTYNLSLPIPESSKGKAVEVKFAEELSNIGSAEKVDNTLTKTDTTVSVASLDHFTIFVVSGVTPPSCTGASITPPDGTTACYLTIQSAITAASSGNTINIAAGTYTENLTVNKSLTLLGVGDTTIINGAIVSAGDDVTIQDLKIITPGAVNWDNDYYGVRATANNTLTLDNVTIDVSSGYPANDFYGIRMRDDEPSTGAVININNSRIKGYAAIYLRGLHSDGTTIIQTGTVVNVSNSTLTGKTSHSGPSDDFAVIAIDDTTGATINFTGASSVISEYTGDATSKERLIRFLNTSGTSITGTPTYTNGTGSTVNTNARFISYGSGTNTVNGQVVARWITNATEFEDALASSATTPIVVGRYEAPITTTGNNTLKTGVTLIIEDHAQVTIDAVDTFTNNGVIVIETGATFTNNGTINGSGTISGTVSGSGIMLCVNTGGTSGCFSSIQSAITAASSGNTINIAAGDYTGNLTITKSLSLIGVGDDTHIIGGIDSNGANVTIQDLKITNQNDSTFYYGVKASANNDLTLENVTIDVLYYGIRMGKNDPSTSAVININNSRIKGYAAIHFNGSNDAGTVVNTGTVINVFNTSLVGTTSYGNSGWDDFAVIALAYTSGAHVNFTGTSSVANEFTGGAGAKENLILFYFNADNNSVTGTPDYINAGNSTTNAVELFESAYGPYTNTVEGRVVARYVQNTTEFQVALADVATTPIVVGRGDSAITTTQDNTLNTGTTLLIDANNTPTTIASGTTLVNNGTIIVETGATFTNNGIIRGTGTITGTVGGTGTIKADHTVTFDANSGSGSMSVQTTNVSTALTTNAFTRTGYTFAGWNTVAIGGGTPYANGASYAFSADVTLYAQWTIDTFTFTRPAKTGNGGGVYGGTTPGTINYGTSVSVTATVDSTSNFTNWIATGAATSCNGSSVSPCSFTMTGDASVQANYALNSYTITFNSAGGSAVSAITQDYGTSVAAPAAPTKEGYTFTGWTPTIAATMPAGGQSLTAGWADTTAPNTPIITTTSKSLSTSTIQITGTAEAGSTITITGGVSTATGTADGGNYSITVTLNQNVVNNLNVTAKDGSNNESAPATVIITHDNTDPTGTIVINGGASYTNIRNVALTLSADADLSGVTEMAFSNGSVYSDWEAYSTSKSLWTLSPNDGLKTVRVKFRDAAGNETAIGIPATITVDTVKPVITLNGVTSNIEVGGIYEELGATANDGSTVSTTGSVNTAVVDSYTITYNATDVAGNPATQVTRTVNVVDSIEEAFNKISSDLAASPSYVANNLNDVTTDNITTFTGLWFEKSIDGNKVGKITFTVTEGLDLSDPDTKDFLQNLGTYMEANPGSMSFDATTQDGMKAAGAEIKMYGINALGYYGVASIIVKDDEGNILSEGDEGYPDLTGISYASTDGGTLIFTTEHFTQFELDQNQTTPNIDGDATLSGDTTQVVLTDPNQDVTVDIASGTVDPTIDVSAFVSDNGEGGVEGILPEITINSGVADVVIPDGTEVTGPADWDGIIDAPRAVTSAGTAPFGFAVGDNIIEIGSSDGVLYFDQAVKITLPGVTGMVGYKPAGSNDWQTITTVCNGADDASNISSPGECYFTAEADTIIWTFHFTSFGDLDTDVCANIDGAQGGVPDGMHLDATGLNCVNWSQAGPPVRNDEGTGGQVLGVSMSTSFNNWPKLAYNGENNVLGAETKVTGTPEPSPSPIASPEATNGSAVNTNPGLLKWILTHKKISLGAIMALIVVGYFVSRKRT